MGCSASERFTVVVLVAAVVGFVAWLMNIVVWLLFCHDNHLGISDKDGVGGWRKGHGVVVVAVVVVVVMAVVVVAELVVKLGGVVGRCETLLLKTTGAVDTIHTNGTHTGQERRNLYALLETIQVWGVSGSRL